MIGQQPSRFTIVKRAVQRQEISSPDGCAKLHNCRPRALPSCARVCGLGFIIASHLYPALALRKTRIFAEAEPKAKPTKSLLREPLRCSLEACHHASMRKAPILKCKPRGTSTTSAVSLGLKLLSDTSVGTRLASSPSGGRPSGSGQIARPQPARYTAGRMRISGPSEQTGPLAL